MLGAECLPEPFAEDVPPARRPASTPLQLAAGGGLLLALLATALPWSRFGVGSVAFGAWDQPPRWSSLAAVAALLGVLAWALRRTLLPERRAMDTAIAVLAGLVGVFALLSIWHPPAFTRTWIGPWIAVLGGAVACAATLAERRARREPPTPRI